MSVFKADGFAGEVIGASAELIYSVPCGGGSVIRAVSVIFCLVELYRESVVAVVSNTDCSSPGLLHSPISCLHRDV